MLPLRIKTLSQSQTPRTLAGSLRSWDVTAVGVGAIVGGGIFATIGSAALGEHERLGAGPSLMLSFLVTAMVCAFVALCYAELASMFVASGSAYSYAYASFGEFAAWMIGWNLILEYTIANVAVAVSWSHYARALLGGFGLNVPWYLATDARSASAVPGLLEQAPHVFGVPLVFNALAVGIMALLTVLLLWGTHASVKLNNGFVVFKIAILLFFVGVAVTHVSADDMLANWQPFFPQGVRGTCTGAAIVFFSFIGFDSVSTLAEETHQPGRTIPRGIIGSLAICAALYCVVAAAFCGILPFSGLQELLAQSHGEPLTAVLAHVAPGMPWAVPVVAVGALAAQTTALLAFQIAQSRIFFAMARDGLLPQGLGAVHAKRRTPHRATWLAGMLVGGLAAFSSMDEMVDLSNVGTLFVFTMVCAGVTVLRLRDPGRARPFKVPGGAFVVPALGAASCIFLMWYLPPTSWWRFAAWMATGAAVYAGYGYRHSVLGQAEKRQTSRPVGWSVSTPTPPASKP